MIKVPHPFWLQQETQFELGLIMIEACRRIESKEFRGRISLQAQIVEDFICFSLEIILVRSPQPHEMGQERLLTRNHKEDVEGSQMTVLHPVIKETWRFGDVPLVSCKGLPALDGWLGIRASCPYL